jgi:hypothetical protein
MILNSINIANVTMIPVSKILSQDGKILSLEFNCRNSFLALKKKIYINTYLSHVDKIIPKIFFFHTSSMMDKICPNTCHYYQSPKLSKIAATLRYRVISDLSDFRKFARQTRKNPVILSPPEQLHNDIDDSFLRNPVRN